VLACSSAPPALIAGCQRPLMDNRRRRLVMAGRWSIFLAAMESRSSPRHAARDREPGGLEIYSGCSRLSPHLGRRPCRVGTTVRPPRRRRIFLGRLTIFSPAPRCPTAQDMTQLIGFRMVQVGPARS
jgi:hypothetical protein